MVDNTRIATGYDVEILIGGAYFLSVIQAAYDIGQIPRHATLPQSPTGIELGRPTAAEILDGGGPNLRMTIPATMCRRSLDLVIDTEVGIALVRAATWHDTGATASVAFADAFLSDATIAAIDDACGAGTAGLVAFGLGLALQKLSQTISLDRVTTLITRTVASEDGYGVALGLYVNLLLYSKKGPYPPSPDPEVRGNIDARRSFLPLGRGIAFGFGAATFMRLANDTWNHWGLDSKGSFEFESHGTKECPKVNGETVRRTAVELTSIEDRFRLGVWGEVPSLGPDPTIRLHLELTPYIDRKGRFAGCVRELVDFDINTSPITAIVVSLSFVLGAALFAAGPGGIFAGTLLMGLGAELALVIDDAEEQAENENASGDPLASDPCVAFAAALNGFQVPLHAGDRVLQVSPKLEAMQVDEAGWSLVGSARVSSGGEEPDDDVPDDWPELVDLIRIETVRVTEGVTRVKTLTYRTANGGDLTLPFRDVLIRAKLGRLTRIPLIPTNIRGGGTRPFMVVTDIRFSNGLVLTVAQATSLQQIGALEVLGCEIVISKCGRPRPYYRCAPDADPKNNFENLPTF